MRALITGCSTGIGRAAALELTKRGFEVIATARRPEALEDLEVAERLQLDVTDQKSVDAAVKAAGQIDVLVNNAGIGVGGPIEKVPLAEVQRLFDTNVWGCVRMIHAVVPQMRERGSGVIVNVTSVAGRVSSPLGGYYSSSKYAMEAISEALHYECNHFGIKVRVVEPGGFETNIQDNGRVFGEDEPPYDELQREWEKAQSSFMGTGGVRPGPEPVAQVIADAIEFEGAKLRWPVGDDADLIFSVRSQMNDEDFESTMRQTLGLTW
ncbi:MAG TPA: SDR family oxidoreductase [Actinomycetota bacterium]|jgi:NAD(P)-dependent dehydrogenase (short-subunit alcohol dehydrogenase family)|nr:SDR family oxidoreductase [Actinomycetota bacterium]